MNNIGITRFEVGSWRPIHLHPMLSSSAVPHARKTRILCVSALLTKKKGTFSGSKLWYLSSLFKKVLLIQLMLGFLKPFLIVPNPVPNYSTHSDQIPYKLSLVQFQNLHHCCHLIFNHNPHLLDKVGERKLGLGFQLNEAQDVLLMVN